MPDKDTENLEDKKSKKKKKKKEDNLEYEEFYEQEKLSSKIFLFFVTILIIAIWLGIIALLIKMDVGGFGSSVLQPILKDVPYVNAILPANDNLLTEEVDTQYQFSSMDEAVERIKELELMLYEQQELVKEKDQEIEKLREENTDLAQYKEAQTAFELEKEKFYEEVVFGDHAPDIKEYKTYYESIDPENAEVLYKQVVEQSAFDDEMKDYVRTYSSMKAKNAAAIFNTMTNDLGLVADILHNMDTQSRSDIMAAMDKETAAKITEILEPRQ